MGMEKERLSAAAAAIAGARALVFTAGAGMGVDSGLPDFRGNEGFWRAYPPFAKLGLSFADLANPRWFAKDPELAWGFYGHRLNLYRATVPHEGFGLLKRWASRAERGAFVFTSNVDGQFQRAGFAEDGVVECHGSIHHVQCTRECGAPLRPAGSLTVDVDPTTFRARKPLPTCDACGGLLRPAILMFGDGSWDDTRTRAQEARFEAWLSKLDGVAGELVVVECGAGTQVPTVRELSERLAHATGGTLVRINAREPEVAARGRLSAIELPLTARVALESLDALMNPTRLTAR